MWLESITDLGLFLFPPTVYPEPIEGLLWDVVNYNHVLVFHWLVSGDINCDTVYSASGKSNKNKATKRYFVAYFYYSNSRSLCLDITWYSHV